jgi:hypothetical protein
MRLLYDVASLLEGRPTSHNIRLSTKALVRSLLVVRNPVRFRNHANPDLEARLRRYERYALLADAQSAQCSIRGDQMPVALRCGAVGVPPGASWCLGSSPNLVHLPRISRWWLTRGCLVLDPGRTQIMR